MAEKIRLRLEPARDLAEKIVEALRPACSRLLVAGSIRRGEPVVGDLEILAIPTVDLDLLGRPAGRPIDALVDSWVAADRVRRGRANGERYKALLVPRSYGLVPLDLYLCEPERWGVLAAIRTGPARFSKALVTNVEHGGFLQSGMNVRDGQLWNGGVPVPTPSEREFFAYAGGWVEPEDRAKKIGDLVDALESSANARDSYAPIAPATTRSILATIANRGAKGATCEEVEHALGLKHQTASALITKLSKAGKVRVVGKRPTSSGRNARVYRLA